MDLPQEFRLEDWYPTSPALGPPLPRWLSIYWPWVSAEFRVSDLVISATEVNPGQLVTVFCKVTNTGAEAGTYTVGLGGDFMAEQVVTLAPGESRTVAFEIIPTAVGTYNVSVDGLSGTFRATLAPVADIRISDLVIQPTEIIVGGKVIIAVSATNYGTKAGSKTIVCQVS